MGVNDQVVADNMSGPLCILLNMALRVFPPSVDGSVIACLKAGMPDLVILDDVSAELTVSQVDTVVGHVLDEVVTDDVAVTKTKEYAGDALVKDSAVVDVIVHDLIVDRIEPY